MHIFETLTGDYVPTAKAFLIYGSARDIFARKFFPQRQYINPTQPTMVAAAGEGAWVVPEELYEMGREYASLPKTERQYLFLVDANSPAEIPNTLKGTGQNQGTRWAQRIDCTAPATVSGQQKAADFITAAIRVPAREARVIGTRAAWDVSTILQVLYQWQLITHGQPLTESQTINLLNTLLPPDAVAVFVSEVVHRQFGRLTPDFVQTVDVARALLQLSEALDTMRRQLPHIHKSDSEIRSRSGTSDLSLVPATRNITPAQLSAWVGCVNFATRHRDSPRVLQVLCTLMAGAIRRGTR